MAAPASRVRRPPPLLLVPGVAAVGLLTVPLVGLLARVSWSTLGSDLTSPVALGALRLSLVCSLLATALSVVLGLPLAWLLARTEFRGKSVVRAVTVLPLVLPPVVGGVALLLAFGRDGLLGRPLFDWLGIQFTFSTAGVVLAETFVAMPFLIVTVEAALQMTDIRFDEVAASLGAGRWATFRLVTAPMIRSSLIAGAALTWARALGEFGATITFAGDIEGRTQTLPLAVYLSLEGDARVAVALSFLLLVISFTVLVALRGRWLGAVRR